MFYIVLKFFITSLFFKNEMLKQVYGILEEIKDLLKIF